MKGLTDKSEATGSLPLSLTKEYTGGDRTDREEEEVEPIRLQ